MKRVLNKKFMHGITLLILSIGLVAGFSIQAQGAPINVSSVKLSKTKDTLIIGKTDILKTTITPTKATNKAVKWYSSNSTIARVDSKGRITAVRTGKVIITAITVNRSKRATCTVTITKAIRVSSVKLNKTKDTLMVAKTDTLKTTIAPSNATNKTVTWKSSNVKIAKVNSVGTVTAVSSGRATITSTTSDGSKRATCTVTVTKPVANYDKAYASKSLVVKSSPGMSYKTLGTIKSGTTVEVYDGVPIGMDQGNWCSCDQYGWSKIKYNNKYAWVKTYELGFDNPYNWVPGIKEKFENELVKRGYARTKTSIRYKKISTGVGEGFYEVYTDMMKTYIVVVDVKTGWFHG